MSKRVLCFAYAVVAYVIFLATFLYAIAFVGGFIVPRRLDGPLEGSLTGALAIDCALLTVFAVQHSVMARRWFKERWTQIVPWSIERSTYVLCASLALLLLFWQWRPIGIEIWTIENDVARVALWSAVRGRMGDGADGHVPHQPLRSVRAAAGVVAAEGPALHAGVVSDAAAVSIRPASAVLRLSARVLDDADDDACASAVRTGDDGLHRAGDSVRGAGSDRGARRGLRGVPPQVPMLLPGTTCPARSP